MWMPPCLKLAIPARRTSRHRRYQRHLAALGPGERQRYMEWRFNFDTGFQTTDLGTKQFFVMVY